MLFRTKYLVLYILLILLYACTLRNNDLNLKKSPEDLFINQLKLSSEVMASSADISGASSIYFIDKYLIISNPDAQHLFKVIQTDIDSVVAQFAKIGEGPCEFQFPSSLQNINSNKYLGIVNRKRFTFSVLSVDSILVNTAPCLFTSRAFNIAYQRLAFMNRTDSLFVGIGLFPRRYALSNIKGDTLYTFGEYPFSEKFINQRYEDLAMVFQGDIVVHPAGHKFISTTRASANIEIYSLNEIKPELLIAYHFWPPEFYTDNDVPGTFSANFAKDNRYGFLSTSVNEEYIYMLFSGKQGKSVYESNKVLVFDWQGNPHKMYILDKEVNHIAVDPLNNYLYAYAEERVPLILKYSILNK